jgi:hypothetical protein
MSERAILLVRIDNDTLEGAPSRGRIHRKEKPMQTATQQLELTVSHRGRRRAPLALDIVLCCSYSCSSVILYK